MVLRGLCLGLVLAGLLAVPAGAEERDERIENARRRIRAMQEEAEELQRAGRMEEAEQHRRKAEALRKELEAHLAARREKPRDVNDLERILKGLEQGLEALHKLGGRGDACEQLERAMRDVRNELRERQRAHQGKEREFDEQRRALEFAHAAMREAERGDLVEQVERAMHAQEMRASGRKDDEAREFLRRAPKPEQLAEILGYAARLYRDWNNPDRADICAKWSKRVLKQRGGKERGQAERAEAERMLDVFRIAFHAFREAEQREHAGRMEHVIHAYELRLQGRRDEEAQRVYQTAPKREEMVELLMVAGKLWQKFGNADKAEACVALAHKLRRKPQKGDAQDLRALEERIARLERAIEEIQEILRRR